MSILDSIVSKLPGGLGNSAKRKAKSATQKTSNEGINKTFS